jgi:hypothetical protein
VLHQLCVAVMVARSPKQVRAARDRPRPVVARAQP